ASEDGARVARPRKPAPWTGDSRRDQGAVQHGFRRSAAMSTAGGDPFGEGTRAHLRARLSVLGANFTVTSSDRRLLDLALDAFGHMPKQRLEPPPPRFHLRL